LADWISYSVPVRGSVQSDVPCLTFTISSNRWVERKMMRLSYVGFSGHAMVSSGWLLPLVNQRGFLKGLKRVQSAHSLATPQP
jgi:hypothetical protein